MNRRISLVTAAAVAGTVFAGSAAIAANIGVLSAAEDNSIGNLSAEATVASPATNDEAQVVDIYIEDPAVPTPDTTTSTTTTIEDVEPSATTQEFAVEGAGTVTVVQDDAGVRVTQVDAGAGWLWKTEQSSPTGLVVIFASSDTIYEFHASVDENGVLDARVDQPIVNVVQVPGPVQAPAPSGGAATPAVPSAAPATAPTTAPGHDDDRDDDDHDDHDEDEEEEDEHDEEEEDEHDEEDEHEGGDDDD